MIRTLPLVLLFTGCVPAIVGEGDIEHNTVALSPYTAVVSDGIDVQIVAGAEPQVILQSDDNILPYLNAHQKGDTLVLSVEKDVLLYPTELTALVTSPDLNAVTIRDGARLDAVDLDAEELVVSASDDGDVALAGQLSRLEAEVSGKGTFDAQDLVSSVVDFTSEGSGEAWLTATEAVSITLTGSAQVNVYGEPVEREEETSGSGVVMYY